jgi:hypothetical protein
MSFLKIADPHNRDYLVQEYLNTRKNIKEDSHGNCLGKIRLQERYSKQLKPVTVKLEAIPKSIVNVLEPTVTATQSALAALPSDVSEAVAINQLLNQPALTSFATGRVASSLAPQATVAGAPLGHH